MLVGVPVGLEQIEAFLRGVVLSVPPRSWQQYVRGAFSRSAPAATGTSSKSTTGKHADQVRYTQQISAPLSNHTSLFLREAIIVYK